MKQIFFMLTAFFLTFMFSPTTQARSKKPAKAYSYFDDNGKATQGVCDSESKIPKKLKKQKEFSHAKDYLGSEKQDSELQPDIVSWKHYFRTSAGCNQALFKVQNQ